MKVSVKSVLDCLEFRSFPAKLMYMNFEMRWSVIGSACASVLCVLQVCSCSSVAPPSSPGAARAAASSYWHGDAVQGSPKIVIDLSEQRVRYFKGGQLVGISPISSGREGYGTHVGQFRIIEKDLNHRSSVYGSYVDGHGNVIQDDVDTRRDARPPGATYVGASMRYFMRITGGIGMHEGYLPGYPASHGCIRLPTQMASVFYNATPLGTPVEIRGSGSMATVESPIPIGTDTASSVSGATTATSNEVKARSRRGWVMGEPKSSKKKKAAPLPPGTTLYLY